MNKLIGKFRPAVTLDDGLNVFVLLGRCTRAAQAAKWTDGQIEAFQRGVTETTSYEAAKAYMAEQFDVTWED